MSNFNCSGKSAWNKLKSDVTFTAGVPGLAATHNPKTDAYRACSNCGKHVNFHTNGKCP